jgi:hypothetical protein
LHLPADNREPDIGGLDPVFRNRQEVFRKDRNVGQFTRYQRPLEAVVEVREGGIDRV